MMKVNGNCYRYVRVRILVVSLLAVGAAVGGAGCGTDPDPAVVKHEAVLLLPPLEAGGLGWCLRTIRQAEEEGCPAARAGAPIIAETLETSSPPPEAQGVDLTTSRVAYVSIDGTLLPTRTEAGLPENLRVVAWAIPGETQNSAGFPPRPVPFDAQKNAMRQTTHGTSVRLGGNGLLQEVQTRTLSKAGSRSPGPCVLTASGLSKLVVASRSVIIGAIHAYRGLIGEPFLACATTSFTLNGWPIAATVLISAVHPERPPPKLPDSESIPAEQGIVQGLGQAGEDVARRLPTGWLVVSKGENAAQRMTLLRHLRATVSVGEGTHIS